MKSIDIKKGDKVDEITKGGKIDMGFKRNDEIKDLSFKRKDEPKEEVKDVSF